MWISKCKAPVSTPVDKSSPFIIKDCQRQEFDRHVFHLHVDGAWKEGKAWSGLDFTASHPNESLIATHALSSYSSTPIQTEIQSCYETISWALKKKL